jgi:hypothetical protein
MFLALLGAVWLLVPEVVYAQTAWNSAPDGTGTALVALAPGRHTVAYHNFDGAAAEDDSLMLDVWQCTSVDIQVDTDLTAITTGGEGYIRSCVVDTAAAITCDMVYTDAGVVTLNGDPATGRNAIYGLSAIWIYWDTTANLGADAGRVWVKCNP